MKKKYYRAASGSLLAVWMVVIFIFSAQPAVESDIVSESVAYRVVCAANRVLGMEQTEAELEAEAERINFPIRKAAHMTEYAILGMFCFAFYHSLGVKAGRRYVAAFFTSAAYASTDEFHQRFVAGRSGQLVDVCIDSAGVLIGLLLLFIVLKLAGKHCEKRNHPLQ